MQAIFCMSSWNKSFNCYRAKRALLYQKWSERLLLKVQTLSETISIFVAVCQRFQIKAVLDEAQH